MHHVTLSSPQASDCDCTLHSWKHRVQQLGNVWLGVAEELVGLVLDDVVEGVVGETGDVLCE